MRPRSAEAAHFTLIDLWGQLDAVQRAVSGWSDDEIIAWLESKGTVRVLKWQRPDHATVRHSVFFTLAAPYLAAGFFLNDGHLHLVGDHWARRATVYTQDDAQAFALTFATLLMGQRFEDAHGMLSTSGQSRYPVRALIQTARRAGPAPGGLDSTLLGRPQPWETGDLGMYRVSSAGSGWALKVVVGEYDDVLSIRYVEVVRH